MFILDHQHCDIKSVKFYLHSSLHTGTLTLVLDLPCKQAQVVQKSTSGKAVRATLSCEAAKHESEPANMKFDRSDFTGKSFSLQHTSVMFFADKDSPKKSCQSLSLTRTHN